MTLESTRSTFVLELIIAGYLSSSVAMAAPCLEQPVSNEPSCAQADRQPRPEYSHWLHDAVQKVTSLSALPQNWNGRGAAAPNALAVSEAINSIVTIDKFSLAAKRVVADPDGGIGIYCFRFAQAPARGAPYIRIGTYNSGEVLFEAGALGEPGARVVTVGLGDVGDLDSCVRESLRALSVAA